MNRYTFIEGKAFQQQHIDEKAYVAVISRATRDAYFGEGVPALGKTLETDNTKYTVLGVVENVSQSRIFRFADIYVPYSTAKQEIISPDLIGEFVAILEGTSESDLDLIRQEYNALVDRLEVPASSEGWKTEYTIFTSFAVSKLENLSQFFARDFEEPNVGLLFTFLSVAMLLFMLLPALNLINLNSSRIMERSSEIGVRKAFGASSRTLSFQFIVENIVVTLIGGSIGLVLAQGILELIESTGLIKYAELELSLNVFLLAIFLCLFFGVLSGVLPAWRMSKLKVVNALKGMNS
jgi:putative ABC transport system permease protein